MQDIDYEPISNDPGKSLYNAELEITFYSFCSFVCMLKNKKMNIANIFITVLSDQELLDLFIHLCDHTSKYDAARTFFSIEPSLQTSKYIKRYINTI